MAGDSTTPKAQGPGGFVEYARKNDVNDEVPVDKTWVRESITASKWNKAYPYQLLIVKKNGESYEPKTDPKIGGKWTYTLPMPPESLSLQMPFAIQTWITMGGSIEEHNGAPLRMISLRGTFGVNYGRHHADSVVPPTNFKEAIFAGTITNANSIKDRADRHVLRQPANVVTEQVQNDVTSETGLGKLTGWYQFRLLQSFLETYAELKKTKAGRDYRLAFAIWKDEAVYLVQPQMFEVSKSSGSPLEYMYSLQFKATKRVQISKGMGEEVVPYKPLTRRPNDLAQFLNSVEATRKVLQGSKKVIAALGADVGVAVFGTMREMALMAKDALAVPLAVADLSDSIIKDARYQILSLSPTANFAGEETAQTRETKADALQLSGERSDSSVEAQDSHPALAAFENPAENFDFFSNIRVGDLQLQPATMAKIANERERVRSLTRDYFEEKRDAVVSAAAEFSASLGLGSEAFNKTYGLDVAQPATVNAPTDEDYTIIFALNRLAIEMNKLVVTNEREPLAKIDAIATVAGFAQRSGIAFRIPRSKYSVPFPYGSTLEMLSTRYLGNPDRWHEIAALNGLQTPYVDEEGFDLVLLTNGAGNKVMVSDATNLFIGQPVWIESRAAQRTKRRITKIEKLAGNQWLVSVDGDPDLEKYTTLARAIIHAFLPNTVNSQMLIFIPSDEEPRDGDFRSKSIPGVDEFNHLIQVGGIDLLLTPTNDLVVTPDGDTKWSVGMTNIIQKIRLAITTRQGTLNRHKEYGLPIEVGGSVADLEPVEIVRAAEGMFNGDPSFSAVKQIQVRVDGGVTKIGIAIEIAGGSQVIPVSFEVKQ